MSNTYIRNAPAAAAREGSADSAASEKVSAEAVIAPVVLFAIKIKTCEDNKTIARKVNAQEPEKVN